MRKNNIFNSLVIFIFLAASLPVAYGYDSASITPPDVTYVGEPPKCSDPATGCWVGYENLKGFRSYLGCVVITGGGVSFNEEYMGYVDNNGEPWLAAYMNGNSYVTAVTKTGVVWFQSERVGNVIMSPSGLSANYLGGAYGQGTVANVVCYNRPNMYALIVANGMNIPGYSKAKSSTIQQTPTDNWSNSTSKNPAWLPMPTSTGSNMGYGNGNYSYGSIY